MAAERQNAADPRAGTGGSAWSGVPSKFTNKYLRTIGIKRSTAHNVHSLRHTVADVLRNAGFMDEQFGPLFGHTKATTTQKYGIVPELDLTMRRKMIEAISYGVKLPS